VITLKTKFKSSIVFAAFLLLYSTGIALLPPVFAVDYLQIISVTRNDNFVDTRRTYFPKSSADDLLIVEAKLLKPQTDDIGDWTVNVTDNTGVTVNRYVVNVYVGTGNVKWVFSVPKTSQSFTLNLPDNEVIDLTPFLSTPLLTTNPTSSTQNATPTPTVPEFPAIIILPLFMALFSIAVILKKKK
jgi:hypothetical protein